MTIVLSKRDMAMYRLLKRMLRDYELTVKAGRLPLVFAGAPIGGARADGTRADCVVDSDEVTFTPLESLQLYDELHRRVFELRAEGQRNAANLGRTKADVPSTGF
jgi:hypothetical protein